jgi:hypothetical protein
MGRHRIEWRERYNMKTILIMAVTFATLAGPARKLEPKQPQDAVQVKKLASVTWDLESHKLVWTVQKGSMVEGEFVPASQDRYEISPDEAAMSVADARRAIDPQEAGDLRELLDTLSIYCVQSSIQWDHPGAREQQEKKSDPKPTTRKAVRIAF